MAFFEKRVGAEIPTRRTGIIPVVVGGGGAHGAETSAEYKDAFPSMEVGIVEPNPTPAEQSSFVLEASFAELNTNPADQANFLLDSNSSEANVVPSDSKNIHLLCWGIGAVATGSSASASTAIAPSNANGQANATFAHLKTGSGTPPDTLNPAVLDTAAFTSVPTTVTVVSAFVKVWFSMAAITAAVADNFFIDAFWTGGGSRRVWQGPALATDLWPGVNFATTPLSVDFSDLTVAQLRTLTLKASYSAGVVLLSQTSMEIDAWAVDVETTL